MLLITTKLTLRVPCGLVRGNLWVAFIEKTHQYTSPGTYKVLLQGKYGNHESNVEKELIVTSVGTPPVAGFEGNPTSGTAPLNVSFTDQSTNNPTSWQWDFGNGGSNSE